MKRLANAWGQLRSLFQGQPDPGPGRRHSFQPRLEALEERALLSHSSSVFDAAPGGCDRFDVENVRIVTPAGSLRLPPSGGPALALVVELSLRDRQTGQGQVVQDTAANLQADFGIDVNFDFTDAKSRRLGRRVILNDRLFSEDGLVRVSQGAEFTKFNVVATACGVGSESVSTKVSGQQGFAGLYAGSYEGVSGGDPVRGEVHFRIRGQTISMVKVSGVEFPLISVSGGGQISPSGSGKFAFGGGSLSGSHGAGSGKAHFTIRVTLLSSGDVLASGNWTFKGTVEGIRETGQGTWSASRGG